MAKYQLPALPLRDTVAFPHTVMPLFVGRSKSLKAIDQAEAGNKLLFLITQTDPTITEPNLDQLHRIGTIARIKQTAKLPDGNLKLLVEGLSRARVVDFVSSQDNCLVAEIEEFADLPAEVSEQDRLLMKATLSAFEGYLKSAGRPIDDFFRALENIDNPDKLVDVIVSQVPLKIREKQALLELEDHKDRLEKLSSLLAGEIEVMKIDRKIKSRVKAQIEKSQKDFYLNEQLNAINKELGHDQDSKSEIAELEKRLAQKKMPEIARERAAKEIKKLRGQTHPAEQGVARNYVDLILDLPWNEYSDDSRDISQAERILNQDHFGLKEVKERILEFLAVRARVEHHKSPILCFMGPPGVGKTSLARSIARTLNRKFEKISLGGVRDEAELRGHRRTYIGALPGKIISSIRKAGVSNPVILLDEIDKLGSDWRGDPSSALLEILDPEQNKHFGDHYLDLEYDLSKVLFITTANLVDGISPPLRDRMEVIRISGYTENEKVAIANEFIIPRAMENHGLTAQSLTITPSALVRVVRLYTREAGVRNLEREISRLCRKVVRKFEESPELKSIVVDSKDLETYLGIPKFREENLDLVDEVGVTTGLAWTPSGGEVLQIEVATVPGKGNLQITGKLGEVMQESAKAALTYIRSRALDFHIPDDYFAKHDLHIHVPEGGIPKDGPSAGITMTMAILSAIADKKARRDIGMTGEITLRGRILPIGGLKEKVLAAKRAKLKTVIYPLENQRELKEMEPEVLEGLELIPAYHADEVIPLILKDLQRDHVSEWSISRRSESAHEVTKSSATPLAH